MKRNFMNLLMRSTAIVIMLFSVATVHASKASIHEKLDSCIKVINSMPHDSTRLQQCFVLVQENIDQYWALDFIEFAQKQAEEHRHLIWSLAFRGCKVRWCHHFHDWVRMDKFLMEQRAKAIKHNEYGNYMSQIGQSAIVMSQIGRYEQAWRYIQSMERDLTNAGENIYKKYEIYIYLVKADYYKYRGEEAKRLSLLITALENNVQTNVNQRVSLHIELIDVFGQMGQYKEALAHADSVQELYNTAYSEKRKALPQSRGHVSDANLRKVEIYQKMGNYPMMKKSLELAEEYLDKTDHGAVAGIYDWWAKYYLGIKDYTRSMEYFDKAVEVASKFKSEESVIRVELEKVGTLISMGKSDIALDFYIQKLLKLDKVHNLMIAEQQDYLDNLENMLTEQERAEKVKSWKAYLMGTVAVVLALVVLSILLYVMHARRTLKKNVIITKQKLQEASYADKEKERFLRNITKLINEPLQHVVKAAKRLSEDNQMSQEEQQTIVAENKVYVGRLLELVNNVLDLSRLEAGMMKYTTSETDIVLMIQEFVASYNMRNMKSPIRITSDVESFEMNMDSIRFNKIISTLFNVPFSCNTPIPMHRSIKIEKDENGCLVIRIIGSLYADEAKLSETERMTNRINKFVMRDFHSKYTIASIDDIIITLNPNEV